VRLLQLGGPLLQRPAPGVVGGQPLRLALHADERGAVGVAVLLQPVGVDQPRRVLLGGVENGLEEGELLGVQDDHERPPGDGQAATTKGL
jgi:hypothetical protein